MDNTLSLAACLVLFAKVGKIISSQRPRGTPLLVALPANLDSVPVSYRWLNG